MTPRRRSRPLLYLLCVLVLGLTATVASSEQALDGSEPVADPLDSGGPLDITMAAIEQHGSQLTLKLTTNADWSPGDLSLRAGRMLCLTLFYGDVTKPGGRLCVGGSGDRARLFFTRLNARGKAAETRIVSATMTRPDARSLRAEFYPGAVDLRQGLYAWQADSTWLQDGPCPQSAPCIDIAPDIAPVRARVRLVVFPRCFGAADRDREHPCNNRALRLTVDPKPEDAVLAPNAPCSRYRQAIPYACTFGARPGIATSSIALIGDSHAAHWRAAMWVLALDKNWRGWSLVRTGCPLTKANPNLDEPHHSRCLRWNGQVQRWFRKHPEIHTVFVSQHQLARVRPGPGRDHDAAQVDGYIRAWRALPDTVKRIIVIRDVPSATIRSLGCVEVAMIDRKRPGLQCAVPRDAALQRDAAVAAAYALHSRRVRVIDLTRFMCSPRLCFPVVGGTLVHKDKAHLAEVFATTLGPYLLRAYDRLR